MNVTFFFFLCVCFVCRLLMCCLLFGVCRLSIGVC